MSDIDILHPHALGREGARSAIDQVAEKLQAQFGMESAWNGDVLEFQRSGVAGRIVVDEDNLHVTAKLGFLLSAMRGPIEQEIRRVLSDKLDAGDNA